MRETHQIIFTHSYKMKTLKTYLEEKGISMDDFNKMEAEKQAAIFNEINDSNAVACKALQEKTESTAKEIAEANKSILDIQNSQIKQLTETAKAQGIALAELKEKGGKSTQKSELVKFIERDSLKSSFSNQEQRMESVVVKAPELMTTANVLPNVAGGFNQLFGNYIDSTIYDTPKPDNFIFPLVTVTTAPGTENIWYVERENEEGDAEFIGEGETKPLADGEWLEKKADIKEVAVRWKMTNRLIMHAPSVVQNFRIHATELVEQKMDSGVTSGDGLGNNLSGITALASPFIVPPALANYYTEVNIWDVINAVATYVRLNNFNGQLTCILNTVWMAQMMGIKNTEGDYIIPPFTTPDGRQVGEVRIVFTNKILDSEIILGDLKQFNVVISEDIRYYEGWMNDDFAKNLSSRKLEAFMGTYLPDTQAGAIVYDDIATIQTAIGV